MKIVRSLKVQIALAFFFIFLLISSIFSFYQYREIREVLTESYQQNLITEGTAILNSIESSPYLVPAIGEDQPIQIWVKEFVGWNLLYQHDLFPKNGEDLFQSIEAEVPADEPIVFDIDSLSLFIQKSSFQLDDVDSRAILLLKSNSQLRGELQSIRIKLISSNVVSSLISLLVAIVLSNLLLKPLSAIIEKAKSIKGDLKMDRLPNSSSSTEFKELSQTFNQMIERIESSIIKQNKFFDSASHELKTPLANMLAEIDLHLEKEAEPKNQKLLKSLRQEVIRLSNLVNDFLLMSQLKSNQLSIQSDSFRLDDLVYDAIERIGYSRSMSSFEIRIEIEDPDHLNVTTDRSKLESILSNLISNALKYSRNMDKISVSLSSKNDTIHLTIKNSVDQKKLFNHGNRLGLWLSQELANKLGLKLEIQKNDSLFISRLDFPKR